MVLDAVSNFVRGNTDAEVGTEDTTVSVADASIFPDPSTDGEFNVVIWDVNNFPRPDQDGDVEIMRVTARDTTADELTVTRGQEMTSAAAHPEGSAIHLSPTAKMFSDIESTFGDFWNPEGGENGQLTADVNNSNTTTQSLEAGLVSTEEIEVGNLFAEYVGSHNEEGSSITLDLGDGVDTNHVIWIRGWIDLDTAGVIEATVDPLGDGAYAYELSDGTEELEADFWALADGFGSNQTRGWLEFSGGARGNVDSITFSHSRGADGRQAEHIIEGRSESQGIGGVHFDELHLNHSDDEDIRVNVDIYRSFMRSDVS